jgi:hypothetical protein
MIRRLVVLAFTALSFLFIGCAPKWTVIRQAEPNPFLGKKEFAVLPVDYKDLKIGEKTEQEYRDSKEAKTEGKFDGDKEAVSEKLIAAMKAQAKDEGLRVDSAAGEVKAPFIVKPWVQFMEPGFYAYMVNRNSEMRVRVTIETADGKELDVIELTHETPASMGPNISAGGRWRSDADWIGDAIGEYLIMRSTGEE